MQYKRVNFYDVMFSVCGRDHKEYRRHNKSIHKKFLLFIVIKQYNYRRKHTIYGGFRGTNSIVFNHKVK